MDDELAAILASVDQSWANVREYTADFERIAERGSNGSARDYHIIRMAMKLVLLELEMRKERWSPEDDAGDGTPG
jgi:hypothetical protein